MQHLPLYLTAAMFVLIVVSAIGTYAAPAHGHDWYPGTCCHALVMQDGHVVEGDCGPADLIGQTAEGEILRQRQTGITVTIPPDFNRNYPNTHDDQYHICVRPEHPEYGPPYVYCRFPPAGM
jgi:hypothetical protein